METLSKNSTTLLDLNLSVYIVPEINHLHVLISILSVLTVLIVLL